MWHYVVISNLSLLYCYDLEISLYRDAKFERNLSVMGEEVGGEPGP